MSKLIGHRIGRREQLSQQERLIQQRRREIEDKLKQKSSESNETIETKTTSDENIINKTEIKTELKTEIDSNDSQSTSDDNSVQKTTNSSVVNKFKNDGSFFEQFLQMQRSVKQNNEIQVKTESKDDKPLEEDIKESIKPIKMVFKENTSKLRAVSLPEESNVRLCEDDNKVFPPEVKDIRSAIERTAISVTMNGIEAEETMRRTKEEDNNYDWLNDKESLEYKYFEKRVEELSEAKVRAQNDDLFSDGEAQTSKDKGKRKRKSRWSEEKFETKDPELIQYAIQVFGNTDISDNQWKQLEDQRKMKLLFEMLQKKQKSDQMLANAGKVKYEYDSDEDTTDGTWEHRRRKLEMNETQRIAEELTEKATGKHHIGDFMPPEELERFMHKWEALKEGMPIGLEHDYQDSKLQSDNIGFKMLQKLGWVEGQGLGADGCGNTEPVDKAIVGANNSGLGQIRPEDLKIGDDEYEAYRKRMMMAYRFRPNPLNNPRRSYY